MAFTGKKLVLTAIGSALALSFVVFGVLFIRYDRGGDPNNEDKIRKLAQRAEADDNPPLAAHCWNRLMALNPFEQEYKRKYYHALVRMRDFDSLAAYTNEMPVSAEFTADEKAIEELLFRGLTLERAHSNELAVACYVQATNLNYFAAAPFLIDCHARSWDFGSALHVARSYLKRFPSPELALRTAEWSALADRPDLIEETRQVIPAESGYSGIMLGYYCDALAAWLKGDKAALAAALDLIGPDVFKTPLFRLMTLESAADGDDPTRVAIAYQLLAGAPRFFDFFPARAQAAVKRFVSAHFPDKLPVSQLEHLADLVLDNGHYDDLELLRVSLLAKLSNKTLSEIALAHAEELHPGDKGLKVIRDEYDRAKSTSR